MKTIDKPPPEGRRFLSLDKISEFRNELKPLPAAKKGILSETSLAVSLIIPFRISNSDRSFFEKEEISSDIRTTLRETHRFLEKRFPGSFEIILVPNSSQAISQKNLSFFELYPEVKVIPHDSPRGKGAAIRTGFYASRGRWIFLTDSDLPYDLSFFDEASEYLNSGYDLVSGNRRLLSSYFQMPVELLKLAYGRHRLGLLFNRVVRMILPIQTTDTQAGIKALSRVLAEKAFLAQRCPGFLFDLELFMTATRQTFRHQELPVNLYLKSEKSTVKVLRECLLVAHWVLNIFRYDLSRHYGRASLKPRILNRYKKASLKTRFFLFARWKLTPYQRMISYLPWRGKILDLGCGHGLFALSAALQSPAREVIGMDHDEERIQLASNAVKEVRNLKLEAGNLMQSLSIQPGDFSAITLIDVLHYFPSLVQKDLLKLSFQSLKEGGTLLVREVDQNPGLLSSWNRFYEWIATRIGLTRDNQQAHHFRSQKGWEEILSEAGFEVRSEPCSSFLFDDILYVCKKSECARPELDRHKCERPENAIS